MIRISDNLLVHKTEKVRLFVWELLEAIPTVGLYPLSTSVMMGFDFFDKLVQALEGCRSAVLFQCLMKVLKTMVLKYTIPLDKFLENNRAIPAVVELLNREYGVGSSSSRVSYLTGLNFLSAASDVSDQAKEAILVADGLMAVFAIGYRFKHCPEIKQLAFKVNAKLAK